MTNRFLISVAAAALIAGTGFANAQGAGGSMSREGAGSSVQQSAPSAGGSAAQSAPSRDSGMTSGHSEKGGKDMKAEGREGKEKSTVGQAPSEKSGASTKGRDEKMGRDEGKMGREDNKMNAQDQKGSMEKGAMEKGSTDTNRAQTNQSGSQTTTGNAATSARVAPPPPEKCAQIVSAIKSEKIQETNINVNVSVGTVLPASVHFYPVPQRIVEIYPEWRGYEIVLIHGRYVIVQPQTRTIVYVIES